MTGRGRGGGRGGRGGMSKSFNREQLNALGVANEPLPGPVTQPPPLFPPLARAPVPLTPSVETDYLLMLKQDLIDRMQLSPCYLKMPDDKSKQPQHELDKLVAQLPSVKEKYDWSLFPVELRPKVFAKKVVQKPQTMTDVDVQKRLAQLEEQESKEGDAEREEPEIIEYEEEELDEQDEEMDDGTDYANNYFDNGEAYEDEDDNLEDGPIF